MYHRSKPEHHTQTSTRTTRQSTKLNLIVLTLAPIMNAPCYKGTVLWNNLPKSTQCTKNIEAFKTIVNRNTQPYDPPPPPTPTIHSPHHPPPPHPPDSHQPIPSSECFSYFVFYAMHLCYVLPGADPGGARGPCPPPPPQKIAPPNSQARIQGGQEGLGPSRGPRGPCPPPLQNPGSAYDSLEIIYAMYSDTHAFICVYDS